MITRKEFKKYCKKNNLRYKFRDEYYLEDCLKSDWNITDLFVILCYYGYKETIEWLTEISKKNGEMINIHTNNEEAFVESCRNGHLELAKWLIEFSKENGEIINIHAKNEEAFRLSCFFKCLKIVKWLIEISKENDEIINIHAKDEEAFSWCCRNGNIEIAKWLCSLCDEYYIEIKDNKIVKYGIKNIYNKYLDENKGIKKVIKRLQLKVI